jgi:hypothetical protein
MATTLLESLLAGAGGIAIVFGLSAWLGRVWAARILEKDRVRYQTQMQTLLVDLKTLSNKELFVHRLQFEKEFTVYSELWRELLVLARALSAFRVLRIGTGNTHEEEVQKVVETYNDFKNRVYDHRPFYAPEIYDLAKSVLDKAGRAFRNVRDGRQTFEQEEES